MPVRPPMDIRPEKNRIRTLCKAKRQAMRAAEKQALDAKITTAFLHLPQYAAADTLLCYVSTEIEVDTRAILQNALQAGKRVAVPRCIPDTREMEFYCISGLVDLSAGAFGVQEPDPERCEKLTDLSAGLCVLPGLAFDKQGFRLGFGKGYYDRFLTRFGGETVGICYACCMQPMLPHGKFDRRADCVVTDAAVLNILGT